MWKKLAAGAAVVTTGVCYTLPIMAQATPVGASISDLGVSIEDSLGTVKTQYGIYLLFGMGLAISCTLIYAGFNFIKKGLRKRI